MKIALLLSLLLLPSGVLPAASPNVLLIMADDLGAENLGCYGNTEYHTPHLDRMAREGAQFDSAYATPVCTPTRAMILTGLHPNRTGFLERLDSPDDPDRSNRLPTHLKTFGHVFQAAGYQTAIAGKWHLGSFETYPDQPASHGFDEHCMWVQYWEGERRSRYFAPHHWESGKYIVHDKEVYGPDYHADFLIDFMERQKAAEKPFLAYFPMNLVHDPLVTPPGDQAEAEKHYSENLGKRERIHGHMVHYMDRVVGRLLEALERLEIEDQTLVIFTGDNGTSGGLANRLGEFTLRGGKRTMNEAGTRVPLIVRWPGHVPPGERQSMFSLLDMLPTLASIANLELDDPVDGLDLSHNLFGKPGKDRTHFFMAFEGDCYFVRDERYRLHGDGRFYDVPVSNLEDRYSMNTLVEQSDAAAAHEKLAEQLAAFMAIRKTDTSYTVIPFGTKGDKFKNTQSKKKPPR